VPVLLDPVDLTGKIVTADAAHTCHAMAGWGFCGKEDPI
jgi:hypothetical protein